MKNLTISTILLTVLTFLCFLIIFKSCDKKPDIIEHIDTLEVQRRITDSIKNESEKQIKILYQKDSIQKVNIKLLSTERNRLLAIVRGFKGARVDTLRQTVNDIPIAVYEAEIKANLICDTLLEFKDVQISLRDSVIFLRELELKSCENMNTANEQALKDLIAINQQDKKKLKQSKSLNKKIPLIAGIAGVIGFVLATFAL